MSDFVPMATIGIGAYLLWFGIHYFRDTQHYPHSVIKSVVSGGGLPARSEAASVAGADEAQLNADVTAAVTDSGATGSGATGSTDTGGSSTGQSPGNVANASFFDDFNGPAGSALGSGTWTVNGVSGPNKWGISTGSLSNTSTPFVNSTRVAYMDGNSHLILAVVSGGAPRIASFADSGSASPNPNLTWTYGTFSASIKTTMVQGFWPAWWAYGSSRAWPAGGEIDCLEDMGSATDNHIQASVHGPGNGQNWNGCCYCTFANDGQFHTYTWIIPPDYSSIKFEIDGNPFPSGTSTITPANYKSESGGAFPIGANFPYGLVLNVATIGGNPVGTCMEVDWVKVTVP